MKNIDGYPKQTETMQVLEYKSLLNEYSPKNLENVTAPYITKSLVCCP